MEIKSEIFKHKIQCDMTQALEGFTTTNAMSYKSAGVQSVYILSFSGCEIIIPHTTGLNLKLPGDSGSWESPEKADNVWRLFIQILLR